MFKRKFLSLATASFVFLSNVHEYYFSDFRLLAWWLLVLSFCPTFVNITFSDFRLLAWWLLVLSFCPTSVNIIFFRFPPTSLVAVSFEFLSNVHEYYFFQISAH